MEKSNLRLAPPTEVKRTVVLARRPNAELRTREHLTAGEVEALIEAAKANLSWDFIGAGARSITWIWFRSLMPKRCGSTPLLQQFA